MASLWSETTEIPKREELDGDKLVKNVVIGAGMAGILIAYLLQEKGQEVIVLEANEIASGQTKNTTAKITSQHGLIYHDMIRKAGFERAKGYAGANETAIKEYKRIIREENIECQFEEHPSFLYSQTEEGAEKLRQEAVAARSLGIEAEYISGEKIKELPFEVKGAVRFEHQAQFQPLEFIEVIAKKLSIYEHTKALEVDDHIVVTNRGVVVAENIIFATHYPFPIIPGYYFLRQHQSRSYVLALDGEGVPSKLDGMYYGIDRDGISLRCAEGKLLFGGSSHRTGNRNPTGFCHLREKAKECYPNATETMHWAAQDCMPHDRIPFIGEFSIRKENWYVATGFQKWGMSTSMVAAMIISDKITGKENIYKEVFDPQRLLLRAGIRNFFVDAGRSLVGLTKGIFVSRKRTCPHMGCALEWNEEEKTWDCPCHGSRFQKDGELIDNPAQEDVENSKITEENI